MKESKSYPSRAPVHTLEDILIRCKVDEVTGCWTWQAGIQSSQGRKRPVVWLAGEQRTESARRAAWILAGKPLRANQMVYSTCTNDRCVCPEHLKAGTMRQMGAHQRKMGHLRGPHRSAAAIRSWVDRPGLKLTPELVQWIRESSQSSRTAAHGLMVSATTVSKVRSNQRRPEFARGASVFSFRG